MAKRVSRQDLLNAQWRELRCEVYEWDDGESGYDCLTRYWCPLAVFEVYWTAERTNAAEHEIYLTDDLQLAGFREQLDFVATDAWKRELATQLNWYDSARVILGQVENKQHDLF
jgi:hypothetical protein